jgi:hypothetical protein
MNLFDVKILNVESGVLVNGIDRPYADLSDGIGLMQRLASDLTGVESSRLAENRQRDQQAAEAALRQQEEDRKRQKAENVKQFFWGGTRFASIGANVGVGFGNASGLNGNVFINASVTVPLIWRLFAEGGIDLGYLLPETDSRDPPRDKIEYSGYRPYVRLNIALPVHFDDGGLFLPYLGAGYGYTNATFAFREDDKENMLERDVTRTYEYTGIDLALGFWIGGRHHGMRFAVNFNNVFKEAYFEFQMIWGYVVRF